MPKSASAILSKIESLKKLGMNEEEKTEFKDKLDRNFQNTTPNRYIFEIIKLYIDTIAKSESPTFHKRSKYEKLVKDGKTDMIAKMIPVELRDAIIELANIKPEDINVYRNWWEPERKENEKISKVASVSDSRAKELILMEMLKWAPNCEVIVDQINQAKNSLSPDELEQIEKNYSSLTPKIL